MSSNNEEWPRKARVMACLELERIFIDLSHPQESRSYALNLYKNNCFDPKFFTYQDIEESKRLYKREKKFLDNENQY